jgi:hypothetical protein
MSVCAPFLLLLVGGWIGRLSRRGAAGATAALLLLAMFAAGNAPRLRHLFREGRGHYLEALTAIARQTDGTVISIGSDHDFRNGIVIAFYSPYVTGKEFLYTLEADVSPAADFEWFIAHDPEGAVPPGSVLEFPNGRVYELVGNYPYAGESGFGWFVYHRDKRRAE